MGYELLRCLCGVARSTAQQAGLPRGEVPSRRHAHAQTWDAPDHAGRNDQQRVRATAPPLRGATYAGAVEVVNADLLESDLRGVGLLVLANQCWDRHLQRRVLDKLGGGGGGGGSTTGGGLPEGAVVIEYTGALRPLSAGAPGGAGGAEEEEEEGGKEGGDVAGGVGAGRPHLPCARSRSRAVMPLRAGLRWSPNTEGPAQQDRLAFLHHPGARRWGVCRDQPRSGSGAPPIAGEQERSVATPWEAGCVCFVGGGEAGRHAGPWCTCVVACAGAGGAPSCCGPRGAQGRGAAACGSGARTTLPGGRWKGAAQPPSSLSTSGSPASHAKVTPRPPRPHPPRPSAPVVARVRPRRWGGVCAARVAAASWSPPRKLVRRCFAFIFDVSPLPGLRQGPERAARGLRRTARQRPGSQITLGRVERRRGVGPLVRAACPGRAVAAAGRGSRSAVHVALDGAPW